MDLGGLGRHPRLTAMGPLLDAWLAAEVWVLVRCELLGRFEHLVDQWGDRAKPLAGVGDAALTKSQRTANLIAVETCSRGPTTLRRRRRPMLPRPDVPRTSPHRSEPCPGHEETGHTRCRTAASKQTRVWSHPACPQRVPARAPPASNDRSARSHPTPEPRPDATPQQQAHLPPVTRS